MKPRSSIAPISGAHLPTYRSSSTRDRVLFALNCLAFVAAIAVIIALCAVTVPESVGAATRSNVIPRPTPTITPPPTRSIIPRPTPTPAPTSAIVWPALTLPPTDAR